MTYRQLVEQIASDNLVLPLTAGPVTHPDLVARLRQESAQSLFDGSFSPEGAMCGALLRYGGWEDAHNIAQNLKAQEGSYWHGIIHRTEPDSFNSRYWFTQAGKHAIFSELRTAAAQLAAEAPDGGFEVGTTWNPSEFIAFCDSVRSSPGSSGYLLAARIQMAEWSLLFQYCAQTRL